MNKLSDYGITEKMVFMATVEFIIREGDWESTQIRDDVVDSLLLDAMNLSDVENNRNLVRQVEMIIEKYESDISDLTSFIFKMNGDLMDLTWKRIEELYE